MTPQRLALVEDEGARLAAEAAGADRASRLLRRVVRGMALRRSARR